MRIDHLKILCGFKKFIASSIESKGSLSRLIIIVDGVSSMRKLYFVLYSLFILLTRRKATEALYIGKRLPRPAFGDTENAVYMACLKMQ